MSHNDWYSGGISDSPCGDKRLLIAPMWSADKKTVLNRLKEYLEKNDVVQGKDYTERIVACELRMEEGADGKGETCRAN